MILRTLLLNRKIFTVITAITGDRSIIGERELMDALDENAFNSKK
jgi:hypothetical protein